MLCDITYECPGEPVQILEANLSNPDARVQIMEYRIDDPDHMEYYHVREHKEGGH